MILVEETDQEFSLVILNDLRLFKILIYFRHFYQLFIFFQLAMVTSCLKLITKVWKHEQSDDLRGV